MSSSLIPTSTPARLTATAAVKLPRLVLLVVGTIYILAGLFFRDPWKADDVIGLATMLTALSDPSGQALLLPQVLACQSAKQVRLQVQRFLEQKQLLSQLRA